MEIKRYLLAIVFIGVWVSAVIQLLRYFFDLPTVPINWPISLGWLSLLAPAMLAAVCRKAWGTFIALWGCAACSYAGYYLQFDTAGHHVGYNIEVAWFIYAMLAVFCVFLAQLKMAILNAAMAVFGAAVAIRVGAHLSPQDDGGILFVWAVMWALTLVPPLAGTHETPTRTREDEQYRSTVHPAVSFDRAA